MLGLSWSLYHSSSHPPTCDSIHCWKVSWGNVARANATAPECMGHTEDIEPAVVQRPQEAIFPNDFQWRILKGSHW